MEKRHERARSTTGDGAVPRAALLVGSVTWHQVIVGPSYRDDARNLRLVAGRTGRERGTIITADGVVVARSVANPDDPRVFRRVYPEGDLYSHVVGYSTLLFGSTGLEKARGDDLVSNRDATISGVIRAILGGDLRAKGLGLTINHELQQIAAESTWRPTRRRRCPRSDNRSGTRNGVVPVVRPQRAERG